MAGNRFRESQPCEWIQTMALLYRFGGSDQMFVTFEKEEMEWKLGRCEVLASQACLDARAREIDRFNIGTIMRTYEEEQQMY
jgi:hypothetical protein